MSKQRTQQCEPSENKPLAESGNPHVEYRDAVTPRHSLRDALDDVEKFVRGCGLPIRKEEFPPHLLLREDRQRLLREEYREVEDGIDTGKISEVAGEYVDLVYIILGNALIQIGKERFIELWDAIHLANMDKRQANGEFELDDFGKVKKPPGWRPVDVAVILKGNTYS